MSTRPITGADPGWPRPRELTAVPPGSGKVQQALPVPWVAASDPADGWEPARYDHYRSNHMIDDDLCQVCGGTRGSTVYVLYSETDADATRSAVPMSGGALCSLHCARLTAAVCPHYRPLWPVLVYAVPKPPERISYSGLRDLDDEVTVVQSDAVHVATVGADP